MANIMDYMDWRGDLSFEADEFNEVDNLILAQLAYVDFEGIVTAEENAPAVPLKEASGQFWEKNDKDEILARVSMTKSAPTAAIELSDGTIITSKTSDFLGASAALLLNALKYLAGIAHDEKLIRPEAIEPIQDLKVRFLGGKNPRLHTDEVLIALSLAAASNENAKCAIEQIPALRGCQVHTSVMLSEVDIKIFKKLGVDLTSEPVRSGLKLY